MLDLLLCPLCPSYLSACPPLPCLVRCSESLARSLRLPSSAIPQRLGCTIWLLCAATIPSIIAELLALLSYSAFVDITVQNKSCSGFGSEKWPAGASVPLPVPVVASLGHDSLIHFGRRGGLLGLEAPGWLASPSVSLASLRLVNIQSIAAVEGAMQAIRDMFQSYSTSGALSASSYRDGPLDLHAHIARGIAQLPKAYQPPVEWYRWSAGQSPLSTSEFTSSRCCCCCSNYGAEDGRCCCFF